MRAREILEENYNQSLETDLGNLIVGAKGSGAQEISTQDLVNQLSSMGYSVDVNSIMGLLSRNPAVLNATPTIVKFTPPEGATPGGGKPTQDSAAQVSDMAQSATKIG